MSGYLINAEEVNMTIEVFKQMATDDESTTCTLILKVCMDAKLDVTTSFILTPQSPTFCF